MAPGGLRIGATTRETTSQAIHANKMDRDYFDIMASRLMNVSMTGAITETFNETNIVRQIVEGATKLICSGKMKQNKGCAQAFAFKTKVSYTEMERITDSELIHKAVMAIVKTIENELGLEVEKARIRTTHGDKETKGYVGIAIFYQIGGKIGSPTLESIRRM